MQRHIVCTARIQTDTRDRARRFPRQNRSGHSKGIYLYYTAAVKRLQPERPAPSAVFHSEADFQRPVDFTHHIGRNRAHSAAQADLVQRADLFQKDDRILGQAAEFRGNFDVGGQIVFGVTAGDGRRDDGGAV